MKKKTFYMELAYAVRNGFFISRFSKLLEHFFELKNKWSMRKYLQ